jgi:hypothetical protein
MNEWMKFYFGFIQINSIVLNCVEIDFRYAMIKFYDVVKFYNFDFSFKISLGPK